MEIAIIEALSKYGVSALLFGIFFIFYHKTNVSLIEMLKSMLDKEQSKNEKLSAIDTKIDKVLDKVGR